MDKSGNLIAGQRSEITEDQFVQSSQQGAAVVSTRSGGGITGSIRADGGVKADYSSSQVVGTRVESKQNLAGSAATQGFREGRSIDAGTAATTIAVGQGALHETAGIVGDVAKTVGPYKAAVTKREEAANAAASAADREIMNTAEQQARNVQQQVQRTSKILQHQSKTSPLPRGGGPQPRGTRR